MTRTRVVLAWAIAVGVWGPAQEAWGCTDATECNYASVELQNKANGATSEGECRRYAEQALQRATKALAYCERDIRSGNAAPNQGCPVANGNIKHSRLIADNCRAVRATSSPPPAAPAPRSSSSRGPARSPSQDKTVRAFEDLANQINADNAARDERKRAEQLEAQRKEEEREARREAQRAREQQEEEARRDAEESARRSRQERFAAEVRTEFESVPQGRPRDPARACSPLARAMRPDGCGTGEIEGSGGATDVAFGTSSANAEAAAGRAVTSCRVALNPCETDEDCCKDLPTATGVVTYRCCAAPGGQRLCADARSFACSSTTPLPADTSRPGAPPAPNTEDSRCPAGRACGRIAK